MSTGSGLLGIENLDVAGKRVLVRLDLNVPQKGGVIGDDSRIRESLPTIKELIKRKGRLVLMSHLGRPKGKVDPAFSLAPVAARLSELLGFKVALAPSCVGPEAEKMALALKDGEALLLENLRFDPREEKNDPDFCKALAKLGQAYVNDAFGAAHRAHGSTEGVARLLPPAVAGFLISKELEALRSIVEKPARPFAAIIGGAKISGKIDVLQSLMGKVDVLLVGGAMAYTFFKARGLEVGNSLWEKDHVETARRAEEEARSKGVKLLLPVDNVIAEKLEKGAPTRIVEAGNIPAGWEGLDVGPRTVELFKKELLPCKTVFWNGPLGAFEIPPFNAGTDAIAKVVAGLDGAVKIIGGGDSAAAVRQAGLASKMTHISTGGGASMEYIEGKTLPGLAVLARAR